MNATNKKGLALLLLGIIFSCGAALEAVIPWFIGMALGVIGTVMMFWDHKSEG